MSSQDKELVANVEELCEKAHNRGWWWGFWTACAAVLATQILMSLIIQHVI